ncbi:MAG: single-stranded-DNA-specific exonuclease RecJ [Paludibacteraceae bacterium]|nr:single-stranded-DNA-specific exonuclease RecJ [Paludibacteraceae bacterium]
MTSKWIFTPLTAEQEKQKEAMATELGCNPIICQLLIERGVSNAEEARHFFRPQLTDLFDPFLMNDMDVAVERINKAMGQKENILIYGDYDVDGITAVALVYKFLKKFYSKVQFHIPDRDSEGYGISKKRIDWAAENDIKLIIILDYGIKSFDEVSYAKEKGIDIIICDHHNPDKSGKLPEAVATLNPKRLDSTYPGNNLAACGVGFKLMQAFAIKNNIGLDRLTPMLDLVVVSIAADIVPITGENRVLAYYGLKQLNTNPNLGLKSIIDVCGLTDKEISISDIVFKIGPRLNASGRVQSASESVELLICNDLTLAKAKSEAINCYNQTRKDLDKSITDEAFARIEEHTSEVAASKSIVIYDPDWHKGVIGIVASRLTELYYKPTIVLTKTKDFSTGQDYITGSGRTVQGFDIYKGVESCGELLRDFGGHMFAVGLSIKHESDINEFKKRFENYVAENILPSQTQPQINIDAVIDFKDITPKFFRMLKQFSPFGPENPKPIFVTKRVCDYGTSRIVGKVQEHLKLELIDSQSECIMNGIAFGQSDYYEYIRALKPVDICYTIEENGFNGGGGTQLRITDIRKCE